MYYVATKIILVSMLSLMNTDSIEATESESSRIHFFNDKEKELILDFHNMIRKVVASGSLKTPPGRIDPVEWDEGLADFSRYSLTKNVDVSNRCPRPARDFDTCWYHGLQVDHVGRNVAYSSRARLNDTLRTFWRPHMHYLYRQFSGRESSGKGLFTQIIWADTKKIGCALLKSCKLDNKSLFAMLLCNYAPNGNMIGEFPYYTDELEARNHEAMKRLTLNSCQEKEYDEDNFSRLKNSLIHPVYKPYHNLSKADSDGPDLYHETVKDDLQERICNVIKNQQVEELKLVHLDKLSKNCVQYEMGQKPITEKMSALEIGVKVCDQVQEFKTERNKHYESMDLFCKRSRLYSSKPRDKLKDSRP